MIENQHCIQVLEYLLELVLILGYFFLTPYSVPFSLLQTLGTVGLSSGYMRIVVATGVLLAPLSDSFCLFK